MSFDRRFRVKETVYTGCHCHPDQHQIDIEAYDIDSLAYQILAEEADGYKIDIDNEVMVARPLTAKEKAALLAAIGPARKKREEEKAAKKAAEKKREEIAKVQSMINLEETHLRLTAHELKDEAIKARQTRIDALKSQLAQLQAS